MARMYVPKGMTLSMDVLPTPPSSPEEGDSDGDKVAFKQVSSGAEVENNLKHKEEELTLKEWQRKSPVFLNLQAALSELGYCRLQSSPHKNSCLLFSYYLCTYAIAEWEQDSRYSRCSSTVVASVTFKLSRKFPVPQRF